MQNSNLSFFGLVQNHVSDERHQERFFSQKRIQKQFGLKRYEPVWAMVHKAEKSNGEPEMKDILWRG